MSLHKHQMHVWLNTPSDLNGRDNLNYIQIVTVLIPDSYIGL